MADTKAAFGEQPVTSSETSGLFAAPSMPKGGGALRGIGESITPNLVTGTCNCAIPVFTTSARGLSPTLSLSYDAGAPSGPFGVGWQLSVPSIVRRTDHGLPRYRDASADDSDEFMYGGEILVRSSRAGDDRIDPMTGARVQRYRPRVEGAFSRIERWTHAVTGAIHWTIIDRNNLRSTFGTSAGTRIADPAEPERRIFQWMLEEQRDDRGNVVTFVYKREDSVNVPSGIAWEDERATTNLYLKRIVYGNARPDQLGSECFQVVFDYGEHGASDASTESAANEGSWPTVDEQPRGWNFRVDPFSSYRATFEIRTRRLCRRVLMFHRFVELGNDWVLVRSTDLAYRQTPVTTYLVGATQTGWRSAEPSVSRAAEKIAWPSVTFAYEEPSIETTLRFIDPESLDGLRDGLDGRVQSWTDLDGEGIVGVATNEGNAWWYKRNLGNGRLAPPELLPTRPLSRADGPPLLVDLAGSGRKDLVSYEPGAAGYVERLATQRWQPFAPFESLPSFDPADRNVRQLDLDGDGLVDLLLNEDEVLSYYPSLGRRGFGAPERVRKTNDERSGPAVVLVEEQQTIFLADMTGDGLTDLVRIRDGEVCYWPNLGHGRFGGKVSMGNAPSFDGAGLFDPARLRLGDIDGSGTADIVYLGASGTRAFFNQAGNSWSAEVLLSAAPLTTKLDSAQLLDLLGSGTSCLLWSSNDPADGGSVIRYLDLMGGKKPHLLSSLDNGLGRTISLTHAASTTFYLADRLAGRPWATRLPFPVQVLVRTETRDTVAQTRIVSRFAYHDGYFDGVEREFRGFGLVEQWDAEAFGVSPDGSLSDVDVPPVHTKTWFHTGASPNDDSISRHLAHEYWAGDGAAPAAPDLHLPDALSDDDSREALRALKGKKLRTEVYADDGTPLAPTPYSVNESSYGIVVVQPASDARHGVYFVQPRESIEHRYERNASDPRTVHKLVLAFDEYGNILQEASVALARRSATSGAQARKIVTCAVNAVINVDDVNQVRLGVARRSDIYELGGVDGPNELSIASLSGVLTALLLVPAIPFDADWSTSPPSAPTLRELSRVRLFYWDDTISSSLAEGVVGTRALVHTTFTKVFSTGHATRAYGARVDSATLTSVCKLVDLDNDGGLWATSTLIVPEKEYFFQPIEQHDQFGNPPTKITRDDYRLCVLSITDPVGNSIVSQPDYRTLQAIAITDANGNLTSARYDAMAMMIAVAITGKGEGHTLDAPTLAFDYHLDARPAWVRTRTAQTWGPSPVYVDSYGYSDGSGRQIEQKVRAEPGPAPQLDVNGLVVRNPDGSPVVADAKIRWVGSGRTVFDNKGNPVKKYEPFFSATSAYEGETELARWGVTPILRYDPVGRIVRTEFPEGTLARVEIGAWDERHWDQNDTVLESSWYDAIVHPPAGQTPTAADIRAANLAAAHAGTFTTHVFDPLGRTVSTIVDLVTTKLTTTIVLDAVGNASTIIDPRTVRTTQISDMAHRVVRTISPDSGDRAALFDSAGAIAWSLGARGFVLTHSYDAARRPLALYVQLDGSTNKILIERTIYGESLLPAAAASGSNLLGRVYQRYDGAGLITTDKYDLKGNVTRSGRRLAKLYRTTPDWTPLDGLSLDATNLAAQSFFDSDENFETGSVYDPLGRTATVTSHDKSTTAYGYDGGSGLLRTVDVFLAGAPTSTPLVTDITYDARGQRMTCAYANGATVNNVYDARTFRLRRTSTSRTNGPPVQDSTYTYDPVGNLLQIDQGPTVDDVFFGHAPPPAAPLKQYTYDPAYRLTSAIGRELGSNPVVPSTDKELDSHLGIPDPNDQSKVRQFTESFVYDDSGNLGHVDHVVTGLLGPGSKWTRDILLDSTSNRLAKVDMAGSATAFDYDLHGNSTKMPGRALDWDYNDRLQHVAGSGDAYYAYDSAGQRVRKVVEHTDLTVEERIYIAGYETYRKGTGGPPDFERETLRVAEEKCVVAIVETLRTPKESSRMRYQVTDHLGSSVVELDEHANVVSYEEYYPYGGTAYNAAAGVVEVSAKRYRYNGKERDEETGFYYYGARYYAPWLGRWLSTDPAGLGQGVNGFVYAHDNPVCFVDPSGCAPEVPGGYRELLKTMHEVYKHIMSTTPGSPTEQGTAGGDVMEAFINRVLGPDRATSQVPYGQAGVKTSIDNGLDPLNLKVDYKKSPAASRPRQTMSHRAAAAENAANNKNTEIMGQVYATEPKYDVANYGKPPTAAQNRQAAKAARELRSAAEEELGMPKAEGFMKGAGGKAIGGALTGLNTVIMWPQVIELARQFQGMTEYAGLLQDEHGDFAIFSKQNGWFSDDTYFKAYFSECGGTGLNRVCGGDPKEFVPITESEAHRLDEKLKSLYGDFSRWLPTFHEGTLRKDPEQPAPHWDPKIHLA